MHPRFPAAHENYPGGKYNASWMEATHGAAMGTHANMWRVSQDIGASWRSILNNIDFDEPWAKYAEPGSINDPDMLQARGSPPAPGLPRVPSECTLFFLRASEHIERVWRV